MKTIILLLISVLFITLNFAQTLEEDRAYFNNCEQELNEVYQELIAAKLSDTVFIENLKTSQQEWLQFRDAQLRLMYPKHTQIENVNLLSGKELTYLSYLTGNRTAELLNLLNTFSGKMVYISDLQLMRTENIHGGIGIDKPYWTNEIVICGKKFRKGIVIHPKGGGKVAYAEFLIPNEGGRLLGTAGYCEGGGLASSNRKMRYRIFVDNELLYGNELIGKECRGVNLNLGTGKILRIEADDGDDWNFSDHMAFGDFKIIYDQDDK